MTTPRIEALRAQLGGPRDGALLRYSLGAGQAIVDARCLAGQIKKHGATEQALQQYEAVRGRAYVTGVAWALLLDRFRPDWRADFARDDNRYLDTDLEAAIRGIEGQAACGFTAQEQEAVDHWHACRSEEVRA